MSHSTTHQPLKLTHTETLSKFTAVLLQGHEYSSADELISITLEWYLAWYSTWFKVSIRN